MEKGAAWLSDRAWSAKAMHALVGGPLSLPLQNRPQMDCAPPAPAAGSWVVLSEGVGWHPVHQGVDGTALRLWVQLLPCRRAPFCDGAADFWQHLQ